MKIDVSAIENQINALQIRERLMLLVLAVVCVLALAEAVWIAPATKRAEQAQQSQTRQQSTVERLQAEAALQSSAQGGANTPRAQLASVNAQIDGLNRDIQALMPTQRDATTLRGVLDTFLQRQEGLSLVRTSTLSADTPPLLGGSTPAQGPERRGLELTVAGSYPELVRYVESLERALPDLRWGGLVLSNQESTGTQLTLQVFVLGGTP